MQFCIEPTFTQQLLMRTDLPDLTLIEDNNLVGFADGRKAVSDNDGAAAGDQLFDRFLDQQLGFGVDR